jgi:outer membrane protein
MKKLSLWLNVVLIVAVAGIYFLHFSGNKSSKTEINVDGTEQVIDRDYAIAYVDIDTLVSNYDLFTDRRDELTQKKNELEAQMQIKSGSFEKEVQTYRNNLSKGLITRAKAQMVEQELGQKQQELYAEGENLQRQLVEEEQVMYRQILNEVMDYLKEYNKDYNYKFIFSNSFGGQLLYTDGSLNITKDVLVGLNESYAKTKE